MLLEHHIVTADEIIYIYPTYITILLHGLIVMVQRLCLIILVAETCYKTQVLFSNISG